MAKGYNQILQGLVGKIGQVVVTTSGARTIMRKRIYVNKSATPAQQRTRACFSGLAHLWATLTPAQMDAWHSLGAQMTGRADDPALSNYQAFNSVNALLLACGKAPVVDAPAAPTIPAALPPVTLTAAAGPSPGAWSLTLASAAYDGMVQVCAAAPASPGRRYFSRCQYKLITTLPSLSSDAADLTAAYAARFGPAAQGRKIAITLTPVSAAGFKGETVETTILVASGSAAVREPAPTETPQRRAARPTGYNGLDEGRTCHDGHFDGARRGPAAGADTAARPAPRSGDRDRPRCSVGTGPYRRSRRRHVRAGPAASNHGRHSRRCPNDRPHAAGLARPRPHRRQ
jgi:hypothetical protein